MHSLANFTTSLTSSFMSHLPPLFGTSARFYYLTRIKKRGKGGGVLERKSRIRNNEGERKARGLTRGEAPEKGFMALFYVTLFFLLLLPQPRRAPSTLFFLPFPSPHLPLFSFHLNGCVRRPVLRCSRGPFSWVTAEGRRRAHRGGEGHKGAAAAGISPLTISSRPCRKIRDTRKSISTVVAPSSPAVKPYYRSLRKIPTRVVSTRSLLFFLFLFSRCLASWVLSIIMRYRRNKSMDKIFLRRRKKKEW